MSDSSQTSGSSGNSSSSQGFEKQTSDDIAQRILNLSPYDIGISPSQSNSSQLYGGQPVSQINALQVPPQIPQQQFSPQQNQGFPQQMQNQQHQYPMGQQPGFGNQYGQPYQQPPSQFIPQAPSPQQPQNPQSLLHFQQLNQQPQTTIMQQQPQIPMQGPQQQFQQQPNPQFAQQFQPHPSRFQNIQPIPQVMNEIKQNQMNAPIPLAPQQKVYPTRTPQQRLRFIENLVMKYPEIFTPEEQGQLKKDQDLLGFGIVGSLISIPYSIFLLSRMRKNPAKRYQYLGRSLFVVSVPVLILSYAGMRANNTLSNLTSKYFNHLSDFELDNFENYYQLIKNQQQFNLLQHQHGQQQPTGFNQFNPMTGQGGFMIRQDFTNQQPHQGQRIQISQEDQDALIRNHQDNNKEMQDIKNN